MDTKILIIDDENLFREDTAKLLCRRGYDCKTACDGQKGKAVAEQFSPDVILCDMIMPGQNGIDLLDEILQVSPQSDVIMLTAFGTIDTVVDAFRKGASDYIVKPFIFEDLLQRIDRLTAHKRRSHEIRFPGRQVSKDITASPLVGQSSQLKQVRELISKLSASTCTVLITGASGTGKDVVARAIHANSPAANAPFVALDCEGIPEHLLESELFGHTKGAFAGACSHKEGLFEFARGGTILLDEIGGMPLALQGKLLRALEERKFMRVGGKTLTDVEVRIIASTNKNLKELVKASRFCQDLYSQFSPFEIRLALLKDRCDDIPILCTRLIKELNHQLTCHCLGVDSDAMRMLTSYSWPGNIRELRNALEQAMILTPGEYITVSDLPVPVRNSVKSSLLLQQPVKKSAFDDPCIPAR